MKITLLDNNQIFISNFENYIFKKYNRDFDVYVFTTIEALVSTYPDYSIESDILIITPDYYMKIKDKLSDITIIIINEGNLPIELSEMYKLNRFLKAEDLINEINRIYVKDSKHILTSENVNSTEFISFYSPLGGSGKSTLSLLFGMLLAQRNKKVLYIPLEFMVEKSLLDKDKDGYDVTYLLCNTKNNQSLKFELNKIKSTHIQSGMDYIQGFVLPHDYYSIDKDTWNNFLTQLNIGLDYDYVIFDLQNNYDKITQLSLYRSHHLFMICSNGYSEGDRFNRGIDYLMECEDLDKIKEKTCLLLNEAKNTGSKSNVSEDEFKDVIHCSFDSNLKQVIEGKIEYNLNSKVADELKTLIDRL